MIGYTSMPNSLSTTMCAKSTMWILAKSGSVVKAVSIWASTAVPVVATVLSAATLLLTILHPAQLLFRTAWEKVTAQNSPAKNSDLYREHGITESTRIMQDEYHLDKALKIAKLGSWVGLSVLVLLSVFGLSLGNCLQVLSSKCMRVGLR